MVQLTSFAILFLSATATLARPTHKRRAVCQTNAASSTTAASASSTPDNGSLFDTTSNSTTNAAGTRKHGSKTASSSSTTTSTDASSSTDGASSSNSTSTDGSSDNTSSSTSGGAVSGGSSAVSAIFPVSGVKQGWSVAGVSMSSVTPLTLTANTLKVTKEAVGSSHPIVQYGGKTAMLASIKQGGLDPGTQPYSGFSFYSPGVEGSNLDLTTAKEATLTYSVYFEEGFDFNLGGKLPGLYGGTDPSIAATCSGGRHAQGCFSARLMFRSQGAGELYLYLPPGINDNDNKCGKAANHACTTGYGDSAGTGTWFWQPGQWQTVTEHLVLNTPGQADGSASIYIDGKQVFQVGGLTWRTSDASRLQGIQMQIFFGGHEDAWRSPKDQTVHFADFSVGILQTF